MNKALACMIGVLLFNLSVGTLNAQPCVNTLVNEPIPTKCFEIVSILVDACDGSNEGKNEMIRLKIGPNPLLVSTLAPGPYSIGNVNWGLGSPSNLFQGWATLTTADFAKIDTINNRIKAAGNCGVLIPKSKTEYIPAGSNLLIITSTAYNPLAQDFINLQDTLYIILQNTGNSQGHFANWGSTSSLRKLILNSGTCSDTVIYNVNKLLDQNQKNNIAAEDGATVNYSFNGTATYANSGCKIPIPMQTIDAGNVPASICAGGTISLNGTYSGNHCYAWRAANTISGTFADSLNLITTFTIKKGFIGKCKLYLIAKLNCKDYKDSVELNVIAASDSIRIQKMDTVWCVHKQIPINAISNSLANVKWTTNGFGKIDFPNQLTIVYTPDTLKDKGSVVLKVSQNTTCGIIEDSVRLFITQADAGFLPDKLVMCRGEAAISLNPKHNNGQFYGATGMISNSFFNPIDTGNYIVTYIISELGCLDTAKQEINVNGFYIDQISTLNPSCYGLQDGLIKIGLSAGKSPFVFQWNNQVNSLSQQQNLKAGSYHIQITDNNNCRDTFTVELKEPSPIVLNKKIQQPTCGLNNGLIQMQLSGGTLPYVFKFNNQVYTSSLFQNLTAGKYYFTVIDSNACTLSDTSELLLSTAVKIAINIVADTCNAYKGSVAVTIKSGSAPFSYNWTPFYAPNPFQNNLAGKSAGMVVVFDSNRCNDTAYYEVPDNCKNEIWIANAFKPASSTTANNQFGPITSFPESIDWYLFRIFNRWGQQVFESKDYKNRWDGTINGIEAATDIYFYDVQVRFQNTSSMESLKGNVTLLR